MNTKKNDDTRKGEAFFTASAFMEFEKESQRVTLDGDLVQTDHPTSVGNRSFILIFKQIFLKHNWS